MGLEFVILCQKWSKMPARSIFGLLQLIVDGSSKRVCFLTYINTGCHALTTLKTFRVTKSLVWLIGVVSIHTFCCWQVLNFCQRIPFLLFSQCTHISACWSFTWAEQKRAPCLYVLFWSCIIKSVGSKGGLSWRAVWQLPCWDFRQAPFLGFAACYTADPLSVRKSSSIYSSHSLPSSSPAPPTTAPPPKRFLTRLENLA